MKLTSRCIHLRIGCARGHLTKLAVVFCKIMKSDPSPCIRRADVSLLMRLRRVYTHYEVVREAGFERTEALEVLDLLFGEADVQRLDVTLELFDLPAANDWKDVGGLMVHIREGHCIKLVRQM